MPCSCSSAGLMFAGLVALIFLPHWLWLAPYALGLLFGGFVSLVIGTGMRTHWRKHRRLGWTP